MLIKNLYTVQPVDKSTKSVDNYDSLWINRHKWYYMAGKRKNVNPYIWGYVYPSPEIYNQVRKSLDLLESCRNLSTAGGGESEKEKRYIWDRQ